MEATTIYHAFVYGVTGSIGVELVFIYQTLGPRGAIPLKMDGMTAIYHIGKMKGDLGEVCREVYRDVELGG